MIYKHERQTLLQIFNAPEDIRRVILETHEAMYWWKKYTEVVDYIKFLSLSKEDDDMEEFKIIGRIGIAGSSAFWNSFVDDITDVYNMYDNFETFSAIGTVREVGKTGPYYYSKVTVRIWPIWTYLRTDKNASRQIGVTFPMQ